MKTKDGVWFNGSSKSRKRRISVIDRLEKQLKSELKYIHKLDIIRINKELNILKQRI